MPLERIEKWVTGRLEQLRSNGTIKGVELVIESIEKSGGDKGPRHFLQGEGDREFIKMNSNSYLGMSLNKEVIGKCQRLIIVTDGIFSMRGDYPDLKELMNLARGYHSEFKEGIITIMDDSHGVGAYGKTGRGTCEVTTEDGVDIIVSTLGKALGVNGGYVVTDAKIVEYLRKTSPLYIYSNPITSYYYICGNRYDEL